MVLLSKSLLLELIGLNCLYLLMYISFKECHRVLSRLLAILCDNYWELVHFSELSCSFSTKNYRTGCLCLTISFNHWAFHDILHSLLNFRSNWSTSSSHYPHISSIAIPYLFVNIFFEFFPLFFISCRGWYCNLVIDIFSYSIEYSWNWNKYCCFYCSTIFFYFSRISTWHSK